MFMTRFQCLGNTEKKDYCAKVFDTRDEIENHQKIDHEIEPHKDETYLEMTDVELTAIAGNLAFFSDRAVAFASFLVASIFGVFTLLSLIERNFWFLYLIPYIPLTLVGDHCLKRFKYYAAISDKIREVISRYSKFHKIKISERTKSGKIREIIMKDYIEGETTRSYKDIQKKILSEHWSLVRVGYFIFVIGIYAIAVFTKLNC